jgi:hypothetical protein
MLALPNPISRIEKKPMAEKAMEKRPYSLCPSILIRKGVYRRETITCTPMFT